MQKNNLKINISGLDAIPSFNFVGNFNQKAITYVTQEMLKNNILASNVIYISISHKKICGYILKKFRKNI